MEIFRQVIQAIAPYFAGVTIGGIISAIICGCLKGAFDKTIRKVDVEKIANKATDKGIERVKNVTFNHSIQPIVESRMTEIDEKVAKQFKEEIKKVQEKYDHLISIIEKLSSYFDGSIGVSEQAKAELKQAISDAKSEPVEAESVVSNEIVIETEKVAEEPKKEPKTNTQVVR